MPWSSQIEGPSPNNTYGFKVTQVNLKDAKALHEVTPARTLLCHVFRQVFMIWRGSLEGNPQRSDWFFLGRNYLFI